MEGVFGEWDGLKEWMDVWVDVWDGGGNGRKAEKDGKCRYENKCLLIYLLCLFLCTTLLLYSS